MKNLKIILPLLGLYLVAQKANCQDVVAMKVRRTLTYNSCDGPGTPEQSTSWEWGETPDTVHINASGSICRNNYHEVIVRTSGTYFTSSNCKIKIPGDGCVQESEKIQDSVYFYLFPQILSTVNLDPTNCVASETKKWYTFNTNIMNSPFGHISAFYLQVSASSSFSSYRQLSLSKTSNSNTFSYADLTGPYMDSWYAKNLYYRLKVQLKEGSILYGETASPVIFFRSVGTPVLKEFDRSICKGDRLQLTLSSSIVSNLGDYKFRAKKHSEKDESDNIIYLKPGTPLNSTTVPFTVDLSKVAHFYDASEYYDIRVFGIELPDIADPADYFCVSAMPAKLIPKMPEGANKDVYPVEIGGTGFHITRYDKADGRCAIKIDNYDKCDVPLYVAYTTGGATTTVKYRDLPILEGSTRYVSGLGTGPYQFSIVDNDGCPSGAGTITLNRPKAVTIGALILNDSVTCHPDNGSTDPIYKKDGEIGLQWTGGIPPYTIDYGGAAPLNTSGTTAIIGSLPAGPLSVTITDNYKVAAKGSTTVYSNEKLGLAFSNDPVKCFGDYTNLSVMPENAQKPNTYRLYDLDGNCLDSLKNTAGDTAKFGYLAAGKYTAEVESGGCIASSPVEITGPGDIVLKDSATKIAEYGGSTGKILLNISGGTGAFSYAVYDGDNARVDTGTTAQYATIENLVDGLYDIYVKDANLCGKGHFNVRVRQPGTALDLTYSKLDVDCHGNTTGEIYPKASGGWGHYRYGFNGKIVSSDTIISGLAATSTNDTVFVTDSANVTYKLPVMITQPPELITSIGETFNLKCFEDSTGAIKLDIKGGTMPYEVSLDSAVWVPGDSIGKLPATENRTFYTRDAHNCQAQAMATITQPAPLSIAKDTIIDAFCNQANGGIHTIISGGTVQNSYQYEWDYVDSSQTFGGQSPGLENIYSGQYALRITDDNLCQVDTLFLVSDMDGPKINEWAVDSVSCHGESDGTIHITGVSGGMPGYTYYIGGTETPADIAGLPEGTYHVRALDSKNCKADMYVQVGQPEALKIYETITPPTCHDWLDGSIIAVVRGGNGIYSYKWGTGGQQAILDSVNSGTFSLIVTDQKGCSIEQQFEVVPPEMPKPGWVKKEALICTGNYVTVDGGDFVSWSWRDEKGEEISTERAIDLRETGPFILELVDNLGCVGLDTFNLKVSDTPLEARLLLPDSARVQETVNVVDVTWPVPDSIEWIYDRPVEAVSSNAWSQHFMSGQEGLINVTLRAWYDGCYSDSSKTVQIYYEEGFEEDIFKSTNHLITGYRAFPNPNSGEFSVEIGLSREAGISISVYGPSMACPVEKKTVYGLDHYLVPCSLNGLIPGVYILVIQAEKEQRSMKIVIN